MIPYTMNLTSAESTEVFNALKKALRLAKEIGTDTDIALIHSAYELVGNKTMSGGFESKDERRNFYMDGIHAECAVYGCD